MSIIGKNEHSNNSYSNWLPSRQMLSKANIVLIGIVSATLLGLSYVWYTNTEDSSHAPQQNLYATTALSTVASGGLQTAATLAIPVFQGMSFLGRLAVGAHLDRQQERRNLFGAGEIDETWIEEILENEPTDLAPKIIHIPQIHTIPGIENSIPGLFAVWESQIRVLEQLLLYPNGAVFDEGVAETIQHRNSEFAEEVNRVFPDGLPKNRESWDEIQMRFLIYFGAARTLHHLGKIETIHRSIDPKTGEEIDAIIGAARSSGLSFCDEPIRESWHLTEEKKL